MRAVVIATFEWNESSFLTEYLPSVMMPLIEKPFIQHIVEYLINQGIKDFDFILSHVPEKIRELIGDGSRWDIKVRYYTSKDPLKPYNILRSMDLPKAESILLIHGDRFPQIEIDSINYPEKSQNSVLFYHKPGRLINDRREWSGWGIIPTDKISSIPRDIDEDGLLNHLKAVPISEFKIYEVPIVLNIQSSIELLETQKSLLSNNFDNLFFEGREIERGIWLGKNVRLHHSARLIPPVYIGENCNIGKESQLGPYSVIGCDCIIDQRSIISNSLLFPDSYIGENSIIKDSLVFRNRLSDTRSGEEIILTEDIILDNLPEYYQLNKPIYCFSRFIAFILFFISLPITIIIALYKKLSHSGPMFSKEEVVQIPAITDSTVWRSFNLFRFYHTDSDPKDGEKKFDWRDIFIWFLPSLINIVLGNLHFTGVGPRTSKEIETLSRDWKTLYLKSKPGLITEALVNFGKNPTEDELYSAEAFYSVSQGIKYDFMLFLRFLKNMFLS